MRDIVRSFSATTSNELANKLNNYLATAKSLRIKSVTYISKNICPTVLVVFEVSEVI